MGHAKTCKFIARKRHNVLIGHQILPQCTWKPYTTFPSDVATHFSRFCLSHSEICLNIGKFRLFWNTYNIYPMLVNLCGAITRHRVTFSSPTNIFAPDQLFVFFHVFCVLSRSVIRIGKYLRFRRNGTIS